MGLKGSKKPQCRKLQKFSATQILREINLRILEVQNQAFLAYLEALNLNEFLHFLMAKF